AAVQVRFKVPLLPPYLRPALQLPIVGLGGPAWHTADLDQRPIVAALQRLGLNVEFERLDILLLAGRQFSRLGKPDIAKPVKELETDAASAQRLVEGRENDVAHAGAH